LGVWEARLANQKSFLLMWAIVESENTESWRYFFRHLTTAIPEIVNAPATVMSDRQKGLLTAEEVLGPNAIRLVCVEHLRKNFIKKAGRDLEHHFWSIANANDDAEFQRRIARLQNDGRKGPEAAAYLLAANPASWCPAYIPGGVASRHGQRTSNPAEALNSMLKTARELPIVELLMEIWLQLMNQRAERAKKAFECQGTWPPKIQKFVEDSRANARRHDVFVADRANGTGVIRSIQQGQQVLYTVDLIQRFCSCQLFQKKNLPCEHAVALIWHLELRIDAFIPPCYAAEAWRNTYAHNMQPVAFNLPPVANRDGPRQPPPPPRANHGLGDDSDDDDAPNDSDGDAGDAPALQPPSGQFKQAIGKRKKARAVAGGPASRASGESKQKCSNCKQPGHNSRRCTVRTYM
jgi:zinc finger SWIM domain-containing protein 3